MAKWCCVVGCSANTAKNKGLKFHLIPISGTRREKWLKAINRCEIKADGTVNAAKTWEPKSNYLYVCGRHFITGEKSNDETHPDYVPSVFPTKAHSSISSTNSDAKMSRFNRTNDRAKRKASMVTSHPQKLQKLDQAMINENHKEGPVSEDNRSPGPEPRTLGNEEPVRPMQEPLSASEREQLYMEMDNLRRERDEALAKVEALEKLIQASDSSPFSSKIVEGNDHKCMLLTGLKWGVFLQLFTFISSFVSVKGFTKDSLPLQEQLFLTLVKLRHNVSFDFLSLVTGVPKSACIDHFWRWIDLLHGKVGFLVKWPDRQNIFKIIPPVFRETFPRLTCIVDCFEIFIDAPKNRLARALCYSSYKKHCTIKVFVGCNPLGMVTFLSRAWGGRASDVQIVRDSGFIDSKYHHPGDQILADRGFTLSEDFASKCSCELLTPAFKGRKGRNQLCAWEVENSRKISSVRIHIERVIGLMKNRFNILKGPMPIKVVQRLRDESLEKTLASCDKIVMVCAALTNMGESIVYKE